MVMILVQWKVWINIELLGYLNYQLVQRFVWRSVWERGLKTGSMGQEFVLTEICL